VILVAGMVMRILVIFMMTAFLIRALTVIVMMTGRMILTLVGVLTGGIPQKKDLVFRTISEDRRVQGNEKTHYHQKN
jgi:hypothetical protein